MQNWDEYLTNNKDRFLDELKTLLKIPSVSTYKQSRIEMDRCAKYIKDQLILAGCDRSEVCSTPGWPLVFGETITDANKPTVLVYGHYDVQPADPLDLWDSAPFEPVVKEGKIFARGASDDKGQMFMHIKALEVMVKTGNLPCNIKFIIEGEEETGSGSLNGFLKENKEKLSADVVLISDTAMISMEHPSLEIALRGMAYMQVGITGPDHDLHSGVYGGAVANPVNILCKMIASLHDENNVINIPGFYDKVLEVPAQEREKINGVPFNLKEYQEELGIEEVWGEKGYTVLERTGIRPALDVNGIWGGFTGEGAKTVLPSKAYAKISMRLVPDQNPDEIARLFSEHFKRIAPKSVKVKIDFIHGGQPVVTELNSTGYRAATKAIKTTFNKEPFRVYSGGSIPVVAYFKEFLGIDSILMGFGLDNDNIHSPNEKMDLVNFYKGIETIPYFHKYFSELK